MSGHRKSHRSHNQDTTTGSSSDWERSGIHITPNQPSRENHHHNHQAAIPQTPFFGPFYIAQDPTGHFPHPFHATGSRRHRCDEGGQRSTTPSPPFHHTATAVNQAKLDAMSTTQVNPPVNPNAADVLKEVRRRIARLHREVTEAYEFYSTQLSNFDSVTEPVRSLSDDIVLDRMWRKKTEAECNSDARVEQGFACTPEKLEEQCDELKRTSAGLLDGKDEYDSRYIRVLVKSADNAVSEAVGIAENARHSYKACQAAVKMMEIVKSILEKEIGNEKKAEEHGSDGKKGGDTGEVETGGWN